MVSTSTTYGNNISQLINYVAITSATMAITSANKILQLSGNNISHHGNNISHNTGIKNWGNNINQLINYVAITSATMAINISHNTKISGYHPPLTINMAITSAIHKKISTKKQQLW